MRAGCREGAMVYDAMPVDVGTAMRTAAIALLVKVPVLSTQMTCRT